MTLNGKELTKEETTKCQSSCILPTPSKRTPDASPRSRIQDEGTLKLNNVQGDLSKVDTWLQGAGLNEAFWDHIWSETNRRKDVRLDLRIQPPAIEEEEAQQQGTTKKRGRPKKGTKGNIPYLKRLACEITKEDLRSWFAIVTMMGVVKYHNQYSYFMNPSDLNDPRGLFMKLAVY